MTIKKLKKTLAILGSVRSESLAFSQAIREGIDTITVVEKRWNESHKQERPDYYPLDLRSIEVWRTYDRCRRFTISLKDGQVHCKAEIFEGNVFDNEIGNLRFVAELILPDEFLLKVSREIGWKLDGYLEDLYEEELEKRKEKWKSDLRDKLLG